MIGSHDLSVDLRILKLFFQGRGNKEIVDTPAGVLLSCTETVGPPGVKRPLYPDKNSEMYQ